MYETNYVFKGKFIWNNDGEPVFVPDKPKLYNSSLMNMSEGQRFEVIIRKEGKKATTKQFGFYFGGIIKGTCTKSTLFEGWVDKDIDNFFRLEFAWHYEKINGSEKKVVDDISIYSTSEMKEFIDHVVQYLSESGIDVLSPDEYVSSKRNYFNS